MAVEGTDVAQLRALALQFPKGAERREASAKTVRSLVSSDTHWRGADAQRFRSDWNGASAHASATAATVLRDADKLLRHNADEEENAGDGKSAGVAEMLKRL
jgi:uncharacterized protein YukE